LGFRVQGSGFGVQGSGFRVWGSGFGACLGRTPSFPTTTLPETMRVGLLFGRAGELERRCAIADAMLFPPRGVNAGNRPKYIMFDFFVNIQRLQGIARGCERWIAFANGFQRFPTVTNGVQRFAECKRMPTVASGADGWQRGERVGNGWQVSELFRTVANAIQRVPTVSNGCQRLARFPTGASDCQRCQRLPTCANC
jgi:hypothetical protein